MNSSSRSVSGSPWPPEGIHETLCLPADRARLEACHPVAGDPGAAPDRESRLDRGHWRSGGGPGEAPGRRPAASGTARHARLPARARWDEGHGHGRRQGRVERVADGDTATVITPKPDETAHQNARHRCPRDPERHQIPRPTLRHGSRGLSQAAGRRQARQGGNLWDGPLQAAALDDVHR
jgi:hypothetical protein